MSMLRMFPQRCACCNQPGRELCEPCRFALASSPSVSVGDGSITAAMTFDGAVRSAVLAFKYRNHRTVARHLAATLVSRLDAGGATDGRSRRFDVVTWAPTSHTRSHRRGYDQAELLARCVGRELGVPCRRLLYRVHGAPQTGRSRSDRLGGPAFRARRVGRPLRVLVVDDVVTTGATLRAAERSLRQAGVVDVRLAAVAATPEPTW